MISPSEIIISNENENENASKLRENCAKILYNIYIRTRRSLTSIILEEAPKSDFEAKFQANQGMYGKTNATKLSSTFS